MTTQCNVDLMYLAWNRLEFTRETFLTLVTNTDWEYVRELFVYDDGSSDGTRQWLEQALAQVPAKARLVHTRFGSPVLAMNHFIEAASAPMLAKADNDAMLPPGWLKQSLAVFARYPELKLLGIEAMYVHAEGEQIERTYVPARFISGLGLYRREVFARSKPAVYRKWFGLEEWQEVQGARLIRGWIKPALPVFLLDRIPFEPWRGYTQAYVARGWQRAWPKYDKACALWHWHWPDKRQHPSTVDEYVRDVSSRGNTAAPRNVPREPSFKIVIPSANAANLVSCIRAVLARESGISPTDIIVVDDGARAKAEEQLPRVLWITGIKPFNFSRNVNLGMAAAESDVILLNDDALLVNDHGFTRLAEEFGEHPDLGVCSASVRGVVGNPRQTAAQGTQFRLETQVLAFICVFIPRRIYEAVGPFDERFSGYGFEDNDFCVRTLRAGFRLGISASCIVEHASLPSTFRTRRDVTTLFQKNQQLFRAKWGRPL